MICLKIKTTNLSKSQKEAEFIIEYQLENE